MSKDRKANIVVILLFLGVIIAFAYSYNASVTTTVTNTAYNDKASLQVYNNEIIEKLSNTKSTDEWSDIIEQYRDIVIVIEDGSNNIITRTKDRDWTALDVKVRTAFEYHNKAYMIVSSVYLLRNYAADSKELVKFVFAEFLIGISALCLLIFIIYTMMLRPYRTFYQLIGEYERGKTLSKHRLRGYIGKVYDRFVSLTHNLEHQQKNQQRIIASISHDIKTPLTSILGYAERVKNGNISEKRKLEYLDTIYEKALEIQELVDEFDEYLGYNMTKQVSTEKVSIPEVVRALESEYGAELEINGISFSVVNNAPKAFVKIDIMKMRRVVGNIIGNSVKHMRTDNKKIVVTISCDREKVYCNIADSGEGVEEEKLEIIFEPLYTSDEGRKVAGLGLSICREIVESHGGSIYAKRSGLGGLEVCIELQRVK